MVLDALGLKNEANDLFRQGRLYKAIELYTRSLELNKDPIVFSNRAQAYLLVKKYDRAMMDCDEALKMQPDMPKALFRRALAYKEIGLASRSCIDIDKCLSIMPGDVAATKAKLQLDGKEDKKMIRLRAVERGEEIQCNDPLIPVTIQCDYNDEGEEEKEDNQDAASTSIPVENIPRPPSTFMEFVAHFRYLCRDPPTYANYFLSIPIESHRSLFNDLMEPDQLSVLLRGFAIIAQNDNSKCIHFSESLLSLATVERFDLIIMFMSAQEKRDVMSICEHLPKEIAGQILSTYGL